MDYLIAGILLFSSLYLQTSSKAVWFWDMSTICSRIHPTDHIHLNICQFLYVAETGTQPLLDPMGVAMPAENSPSGVWVSSTSPAHQRRASGKNSPDGVWASCAALACHRRAPGRGNSPGRVWIGHASLVYQRGVLGENWSTVSAPGLGETRFPRS